MVVDVDVIIVSVLRLLVEASIIDVVVICRVELEVDVELGVITVEVDVVLVVVSVDVGTIVVVELS